jgi:hypothetical protein
VTTTNNTATKGGKGSLSQATRAIKETSGRSIDQNKGTHHKNPISYPFATFLPQNHISSTVTTRNPN